MSSGFVEAPVRKDDLRIVILHRGWVVVGFYHCVGDDVTVTNASVIRVWGTERGIGQIALEGPTHRTILDFCGTVRVHKLAIIGTIDCVRDKWRHVL